MSAFGSSSYKPTSGSPDIQPHHVPMQFVQAVFSPDGSSNTASSSPYARSPELRVSHKLAERKRRKEMKDLFEELKDSMPEDSFRGSKASKWEILSKAVDYIRNLQQTASDRESLLKERDELKAQIEKLTAKSES
ncbi:hypothetical protein HK104_010158 [Borealophlyctis nickersoniae]|nr:hypothetical protein HK104_010158 [Borealophlyctis nickersoniae]